MVGNCFILKNSFHNENFLKFAKLQTEILGLIIF